MPVSKPSYRYTTKGLTEGEGGVGRDGARTAFAVAHGRRDSEHAFAANLHPHDTLIPALDDCR
jgi:hypothetical protein